MKKSSYMLVIFYLLFIPTLNAQNNIYYYYKGEKIYLELDKNYLNIITSENFQKSSVTNLEFKDFTLEDEDLSIGGENLKIARLEFQTPPTDTEFNQKINSLKNSSNIRNISFYFKRTNVNSIGTSNIFYVKLKKTDDYDILKQIANKKNVEIINQNKFMPSWYKLAIMPNTEGTSLETSNYFYETGLFENVDPAFMFDFSSNCANDPYFSQLWGLYNSSNPNIDINACDAWDFSLGNGVNVAILDHGIDKTHTDLSNNISNLSYNTETGTIPSVFWSGSEHGTHVAGIIGAIKDNNLQVVGVAPKSSLISISNKLIITSTISEKLADGINWAWQNGADIINNSWGDQGGVYYNSLHSTLLENAILNAINNGRNGLGTIVVFASGNFSPTIDYPANFHPDILCVGSITSAGVKSSFSGFGNELDVVAPGSNILSTIPNNGTATWSGTSMAAPHVSGLVALILSVNPNLNGKQVRDIIENTAQKVGSYNYTTTSGRTNGRWNNEMGYGLIDAAKAVIKAKGGISGPDEFCVGNQITYTYTNSIPNGATITWEYPTNRMYIISGQGTSSCTFGSFTIGNNNIIKAKITNNGVEDLYGKMSNILPEEQTQTPTIIIALDNPSNLTCCGQTYTFNHTVCENNCTNIEWSFNVYYQSPQDYYGFARYGGTGYITAQKNTFAPLIVGARSRNIPVNCGTPSAWSNEISRYYGTISSTKLLLSTSQANYNSEIPLSEYYSNIDNNLYIETVDLYVWLESIFGNRNLDNNEVDKIKTLIKNEKSFNFIRIQIYNFYGVKLFDKNFKQGSNIISFSNFENGIYFIKYNYGGYMNTKTIIKN